LSDIEYDVWNPEKVGPADKCLVCFTPNPTDQSFCSKCGKEIFHFDDKLENESDNCFYHSSSQAIANCSGCLKPICESCLAEKYVRFSFIYGSYNQVYCKHCIEKIESIKQDFNNHMNNGFCSKHHNQRSTFRCKECNITLCDYCSYFHYKGILRKKIDDGPFCLVCYRIAFMYNNRKNWISGAAINSLNLVK